MPGALDVARVLEEGRLNGACAGPLARLPLTTLARALSSVWGHVSASTLVRPMPRPPHVKLVAVGGSTLGGSGKTPVAIACARWLAEAGARVALVGHAYRAAPLRARVVSENDPLAEVGDEALVAAIALAGTSARVVVGRTRREALALASMIASVVVVDGVSQTRPRASLALLAVDANSPWGTARAVPPCGDLRAPVSALVAAADQTVRVGEAGDASASAWTATSGVWVLGQLRTWEWVRGVRVGLVVALARPERVVASLARHGVTPTVVVRCRDHGPVSPGALARAPPVDLWLATPKCAFHVRAALERVWQERRNRREPTSVPDAAALPGQVLGVLDHTLILGPEVTRALARLDPANAGQ